MWLAHNFSREHSRLSPEDCSHIIVQYFLLVDAAPPWVERDSACGMGAPWESEILPLETFPFVLSLFSTHVFLFQPKKIVCSEGWVLVKYVFYD